MMICLYEFTKMIKLKSVFPYLIGTLLFIYGNIINVDHESHLFFINIVGVLLFLTIFISFASILLAKREEV